LIETFEIAFVLWWYAYFDKPSYLLGVLTGAVCTMLLFTIFYREENKP
jgi:hypothetical protein